MNIHWQKLLVKTILWLATEICLSSQGLDLIADYSEFLYQPKEVTSIKPASLTSDLAPEQFRAKIRF